jgi:hypothetical protein
MPTGTEGNVSREVAPLVSIRSARKRNRWHGPGVMQCLAEFGTISKPRKATINRDRVLGLGTFLAVVAIAWSAVGFALWHFLR